VIATDNEELIGKQHESRFELSTYTLRQLCALHCMVSYNQRSQVENMVAIAVVTGQLYSWLHRMHEKNGKPCR